MDNIGTRVRAEREAQDIDRKELARLTGIGYSTLAELERGGMQTSTKLRVIADALNVSLRWLETGKGPKMSIQEDSPEISRREPVPGYVRFELLDGVGGMGAGVANSDYPEVLREVDVAEWEVRRKLGFMPKPGRVRMITGRGPSMRPKIDHGEVVFVDSTVTSFDGDAIYVINVNGETQIKILQMRPDGLYVVSANDAYPSYRIEDPEGLFIGGRVLSVLGMREL